MFLHFNESGVFVGKSDTEQAVAYNFPAPAGREVGERYSVVDGALVDSHPDLSDEEFTLWFADQQRLANEVIAAEVAKAAASKLSKIAFMDRFTLEEMAGIYTAAKTNVVVEIFLDKMKLAEFIDVADANTIAGVNALASAGLLTEARAAEILAV